MKINLKQEHTLNTYMSSEKPHSLQRINIIYNTYTRLADTQKRQVHCGCYKKIKNNLYSCLTYCLYYCSVSNAVYMLVSL